MQGQLIHFPGTDFIQIRTWTVYLYGHPFVIVSQRSVNISSSKSVNTPKNGQIQGQITLFREPISPKFEPDLRFYVIILVPKFLNNPLNFDRVIAPTTLK